MKVHLETVEGGVYCHVNNKACYQEDTLKRSPRMADVTCKRCYRRFHRLPINATVTIPGEQK